MKTWECPGVPVIRRRVKDLFECGSMCGGDIGSSLHHGWVVEAL